MQKGFAINQHRLVAFADQIAAVEINSAQQVDEIQKRAGAKPEISFGTITESWALMHSFHPLILRG